MKKADSIIMNSAYDLAKTKVALHCDGRDGGWEYILYNP
jgi:hypothetical protein